MPGSSIKYFLVAQSLSKGDFELITIDSNEIPDLYRCVVNPLGKLETIDLFTTNFSNSLELADYLYSNHKIKDKDVCFYIAFHNNKSNDLNFYEVLYRNNKLTISDLREVASKKLGLTSSSSYDYSISILKRFFRTVEYYGEFYQMLDEHLTNIYDKFVDEFKNKDYEEIMEKLKTREAGWIFGSYPLLRNLVEAQDRYFQMCSIPGDMIENLNLESFKNDYFRTKVKGNLSLKVNPSYNPNQITLFDYAKELQEERRKESVKNERKFKLSQIDTYPEVPMKEKRIFVMNTFRNIPSQLFQMTKNGKVEVNTHLFSNISEYDSMCLQKCLDPYTRLHACLYTRFIKVFYREKENGNSFTTEIQKDIGKEYYSLNHHMYRYDKHLDRAYVWCKTYLKCMKENEKESGTYVKTIRSSKYHY